MNKIVLALIVGILIVGVLSAYLLLKPKSTSTTNTDSSSNVEESMQKEEGPKDTIYDGNTFVPNTVTVKKGDTVGITNTTNKKVSIAITGKKAAPIVQVEPNSTQTYPNIQEDGTYSFKDITEEIEKQNETEESDE